MHSSNKSLWYFGYGANMSSKTFQRSYRRLHPTSAEAATLRGYRLSFSEPGIPFFEPSFANIEKDPAAVCEGVLYRITEKELDDLDISEGGRAYNIISVTVDSSVHGSVEAYAFQSKQYAHGLKPSKRYVDILIEGAEEHGLSEAWITMLRHIDYVDRTPYLFLRGPLFAAIRFLRRFGAPHPFLWWKKHHVRKTARKQAIQRSPQ